MPIFLDDTVAAWVAGQHVFINVGPADNGDVTVYTGTDGKKNCRQEHYDYSKIEIGNGWKTDWVINNVLLGRYTEPTNNAYWKWYYGNDYDAPAKCDYATNCHGFAFPDVGDHPRRGVDVVNSNGPDPACYVAAVPVQTAIVSFHAAGHTIKISWTQCNGNWIITKSTEQFRESGTFKRTHTCAEGALDVWERHKSPPAGALTPAIPSDGTHLKKAF